MCCATARVWTVAAASILLFSSQMTIIVSAVKLDNTFYDLFSLSYEYNSIKYGDVSHLRELFLKQHLNENTARLMYAFARAFVRSPVKRDTELWARPYRISSLGQNVCKDKARYDAHRSPDVPCHFRIFVQCVEAILNKPFNCLMRLFLSTCPVPRAHCGSAIDRLLDVESRAWLLLWVEETTETLKKYSNYTATQIEALPRKSCLQDSQFLSAVFGLALCSELYRQASLVDPRILHPQAELYCPDPCLQSPCSKPALANQLLDTSCTTERIFWENGRAIAHRWDDLELQRQHKLRPNYLCNCRLGKWMVDKQSCESSMEGGNQYRTCSPTIANRHFPCSSNGTSKCYENKDSEEVPFICRCKEGFVGVFCQEELNPCFHAKQEVTYQGKLQYMTGNRLCNVNNGGLPMLISSTARNKCKAKSTEIHGYVCECTEQHYRLIRLAVDNCLGTRRACDSKLCINGQCTSSPDLTADGMCRCREGWGGDRCDVRLQDWGVWTSCWPVCGENRTRRRERLGDRRFPGRLFAETEICPSRYCTADTDEAEYTAYQTLLYASCADSVALTGSVLLALLIFGVLRFWRPRFAPRDLRYATT